MEELNIAIIFPSSDEANGPVYISSDPAYTCALLSADLLEKSSPEMYKQYHDTLGDNFGGVLTIQKRAHLHTPTE